MLGGLFKTLGKSLDTMARDSNVQTWLDDLAEARKREKNYLTDARRVVKLYEAKEEADYNILYANTETLMPSLYNSTPRPRVKPRFRNKEVDPTVKFAAKVAERMLEFLVDANQPDYTPFDDLQKDAVLQALVPGRGMTRFKYDALVETTPAPAEKAQEAAEGEPDETLTYETVCGEEVEYDRVLFGYYRAWSELPWLAFEHFWTREDCVKNLPKGVGEKISLTATPADSGDKPEKFPANSAGVKFAHVYEIWDKRDKKVKFISEGWPSIIKEVDDPLKLSNFFPIPRPMTFFLPVSSTVPTPLYLMYEKQAKELNDVTRRISAITRAMKVRGFYDSTLTGLDLLLNKPDNTLLPAQNVAALQQGQSLEKSIWLMPLAEMVQALQQLYINRSQILQVIYALTGIADIMRGSSAASETLGAQEIKQQWGTLRLKRGQKEVMRYSRDCLRIELELAAEHLGEESWEKMTGLKLPTKEIKAQAQQFLQQAQQMAQMAQQPPQPGQPPAQPPQQPDPAQLKQAQAAMKLPTWDDVLTLLKNDLSRNFAIDIETNSTIDAEATEDKQEVAEFMNAMAQWMSGITPMVEQGIIPFDVVKGMTKAIVQRFRFGQEIEDELDEMQAPPPKQDPAQAKADAELKMAQEKHQLDMQMGQQELQMKKELAQLELETAKQLAQIKMQEAQGKLKLQEEKMQLDAAAGQQKLQQQTVEHQQTIQAAAETHQFEQAAQAQSAQQSLQHNAQAGEQKLELAARAAAQKPKAD